MATDATVAPRTVWPSEVERAAGQQGCAAALPKVWEITRRIFPDSPHIDVHVEDDPEIADLRFIVFDVFVNGWDASRLARAHWQWIEEKTDCCSTPNHIVLGFRT